jgi:hypothetical protein
VHNELREHGRESDNFNNIARRLEREGPSWLFTDRAKSPAQVIVGITDEIKPLIKSFNE